jgi:proteasome assembly chaperone (PAC2) family protein
LNRQSGLNKMKETYVKETSKPELKSPILIEGLPGMGMVGKIAARFVIKQLNAQRFAELYSPHFPYYVLVNKKGSVRLLRAEFFYGETLPEKATLFSSLVIAKPKQSKGSTR